MEYETTKPDAASQAMVSIAGLDASVVEGLCKELAVGGKICQIANYLFPKGYACAGNEEQIKALQGKASDAGAIQAKLLKTSGAFHTPIMAPARAKLLQALESAKASMKPPKCKVYMNVTSKPIDSSA